MMKVAWVISILIAGALAIPAMAQADDPKAPTDGSAGTIEPDNSAALPDSTSQPQDALKAYEQGMASVTVQTYLEVAQIVKAFRAGEISSEQAQYLTRRSYELGIIRLQFLDTLHQILATGLSKQGTPEKPDEEIPAVETSEDTIIVAPPASSQDIPESVAKYLELTGAQIALIQARVMEGQRQIQPLLQQLTQNRRALTTATQMNPSSNSQIRKLAVEQSHVLKRLIIANSQLQHDIYQVLTATQRKKLDEMRSDDGELTSRLFAQR